MLSKDALRNSFSLALTNGLLIRYQRIPSAAFVAREFNLRAPNTEPITQESARRWLRGMAIPGLDKLLVLRAWLELDLNAIGAPIIDSEREKEVAPKEQLLSQPAEFVELTESIKEALQLLMKDVGHLEQKLTKKK
jgi:hypothetical protein